MKKIVVHLSLMAVLMAGVTLQSCKSKPKDSDIQASFAKTAMGNASMSNITGTVNEGVLTLNGQCPDEACKTSAEQAARGTEGVKSVINNITVMPAAAPVTVDNDAAIRTSASGIAQRFPGVTADVQNGRVILRGTVKSRDELQKVIMAFNEANIRSFDNQITVK